MEETLAARYWCHMCSQMVNPVMEVEIKCPFCQGGFIEEMGTTTNTRDTTDSDTDLGSDIALSLWAPILLGMMSNPRRRRRFGQQDLDGENGSIDPETNPSPETDLDRELETFIRRRRRSPATFLHMLQGMQTGMTPESSSESSEGGNRDRERVILINPLNQTIIVRGSYDPIQGQNERQAPIGNLGDYFIGPGLDILLRHLAETDPNRHGTPPAKKEAVEALPNIKIGEIVQCSVCLDDFEIGDEAKEMPCKHKFHSTCITPWLELHSSCPVCRFQLPADEPKLDSDGSMSGNNNVNNSEGEDGEGRNESARRFTIPWPFNGLFSGSGSQNAHQGDPRNDES